MTDPRLAETVSIRVRKRPVEVDAWQYDGANNIDQAPAWVREYSGYALDEHGRRVRARIKPDLGLFGDWFLCIPTLEGNMVASAGDWLIRGIKGEVYPCKPDIFEETYERV